MSDDRRLALLRAALGFLQIAPRAPDLRLRHRWLDNWTGLGLVVVGIERQGVWLMDRSAFIASLALGTLAVPRVASAQPVGRPPLSSSVWS